MSLLTAMCSANTGLESASTELSIISDNIANANTVGFKTERAAFEDALYQSVLGGGGQIGLGSRLEAVQRILTQGALTSTGINTDLALQGSGFFVLHGTHGGQEGEFFTRAGQFTIDKAGFLVNLDGLRVQGFPADPTGVVSTIPGDLLVGNAQATPIPTGSITMKGNLQSNAAVIAAPWNPLDPSATSNFATSMTVYDALGSPHAVQAFFRVTASGQWDWHAMTDGKGVTGGTPGQLTEIASGTLAFSSTGALTAVTQASNFNPIGAVNPQPLTFDFGDPTGSGGTGFAGMTQFASQSAATFVGQDGYPAGQLSGVQVEKDGVISGVFSNGQHRALGAVAVAGFPAADQLQRIGGNLLIATVAAGQAVIGGAGEGGRASLVSGVLEQSNVDIADQFVRMIAAQRTFEANAKTITTSDQLLSELISLKR
jgi:flagellar hook protein FlgE